MLVNVLCPADELTPNGVDSGLAKAVDRQLAVAGAAHLFMQGLAATNAASRQRFGLRLDQLSVRAAGAFLDCIRAGRVASNAFPLAAWLNDVANPLLIRASFSAPVYDTYNNRVFWKLCGHRTGGPTDS